MFAPEAKTNVICVDTHNCAGIGVADLSESVKVTDEKKHVKAPDDTKNVKTHKNVGVLANVTQTTNVKWSIPDILSFLTAESSIKVSKDEIVVDMCIYGSHVSVGPPEQNWMAVPYIDRRIKNSDGKERRYIAIGFKCNESSSPGTVSAQCMIWNEQYSIVNPWDAVPVKAVDDIRDQDIAKDGSLLIDFNFIYKPFPDIHYSTTDFEKRLPPLHMETWWNFQHEIIDGWYDILPEDLIDSESNQTATERPAGFKPDLIVETKDGPLRVDKLVLYTNCLVFRKMLSSGMKEQSESKISLVEYSKWAVQIVLRFLYDGATKSVEDIKDWNRAVELLRLCHYLQIESLEGVTVGHIRGSLFTPQNVIPILKLAVSFGGIAPTKPKTAEKQKTTTVGASTPVSADGDTKIAIPLEPDGITDRCRWTNPLPADILRSYAIKYIVNNVREVVLMVLPAIVIPGENGVVAQSKE